MLTPGAASVDALPPEVDNGYLQESVAETHNPIAVGHAPSADDEWNSTRHSAAVKALEALQNYAAIKVLYTRLILFQLIDCFALIG